MHGHVGHTVHVSTVPPDTAPVQSFATVLAIISYTLCFVVGGECHIALSE